VHTNSDLHIQVNPDHPAKVSQGVKCEVLGQSGLSFTPIGDPGADLLSQECVRRLC
jgi:N-acyl-D-amino-acid deacylase